MSSILRSLRKTLPFSLTTQSVTSDLFKDASGNSSRATLKFTDTSVPSGIISRLSRLPKPISRSTSPNRQETTLYHTDTYLKRHAAPAKRSSGRGIGAITSGLDSTDDARFSGLRKTLGALGIKDEVDNDTLERIQADWGTRAKARCELENACQGSYVDAQTGGIANESDSVWLDTSLQCSGGVTDFKAKDDFAGVFNALHSRWTHSQHVQAIMAETFKEALAADSQPSDGRNAALPSPPQEQASPSKTAWSDDGRLDLLEQIRGLDPTHHLAGLRAITALSDDLYHTGHSGSIIYEMSR